MKRDFFLLCIFMIIMKTLVFSEDTLIENFQKKGYVELKNETFLSDFYKELYQHFENYIQLLQSNKDYSERMAQIEEEFEGRGMKTLLGSAPVGLVDSQQSGKTKKIYIHFSRELYNLIQEKDASLLEVKEIGNFLSALLQIYKFSDEYFSENIHQLSKDFEQLNSVMYGNRSDLSIIVKVVRYNQSSEVASHPHFDFSGFSLLMDNSEISNTNKNNETLVIAPFSSTLTWQDLTPPKRDFSNQRGYSSTLFIPGLGLNLKGIPIAPTPHAVKSQEKTRYAVIVFAMIPNFEVTYDQIRVSMN